MEKPKCDECGFPTYYRIYSLGFGRICQVCLGMLQAIHAIPYWQQLHGKWYRQQKNNDKLKPGGQYFSDDDDGD